MKAHGVLLLVLFLGVCSNAKTVAVETLHRHEKGGQVLRSNMEKEEIRAYADIRFSTSVGGGPGGSPKLEKLFPKEEDEKAAGEESSGDQVTLTPFVYQGPEKEKGRLVKVLKHVLDLTKGVAEILGAVLCPAAAGALIAAKAILSAAEAHEKFAEKYEDMLGTFLEKDIFVANTVIESCKRQAANQHVAVVVSGALVSTVSSTVDLLTGMNPADVVKGSKAAYSALKDGTKSENTRLSAFLQNVDAMVSKFGRAGQMLEKMVFPIPCDDITVKLQQDDKKLGTVQMCTADAAGKYLCQEFEHMCTGDHIVTHCVEDEECAGEREGIKECFRTLTDGEKEELHQGTLDRPVACNKSVFSDICTKSQDEMFEGTALGEVLALKKNRVVTV